MKEDITLRKSYQDLRIPFNTFIECMCNNNLDELVIEGSYTYNELRGIYENIYLQFIEAINNEDVIHKFNLAREISMIENRVKLVSMVLDNIAKYGINKDITDGIKALGYMVFITPNESNIGRYIKSVTGCVNADILELQEKVKQYNESSNTDTITVDRNYFEKVIVSIELAFKITIDIDSITTAKYCEYVNQYQIYIKNKQQKKIQHD